MIVRTERLMRRVHAGLRSEDPGVLDAAESCLSYLVLHLRLELVKLPEPLVRLYQRLPED